LFSPPPPPPPPPAVYRRSRNKFSPCRITKENHRLTLISRACREIRGYACNKNQTQSNIPYQHSLFTGTAAWISLLFFGLFAAQNFFSCGMLFFILIYRLFSLSLCLPQWDCGTTDWCCIGHSERFMSEVSKVIDLELVTHIGRNSVPW